MFIGAILQAFVFTIFLYSNTKIYLHQTCFMSQKINTSIWCVYFEVIQKNQESL
jgi:hypothetical protein